MERKLDISDVFDRTFKVYTQQASLLIPAALLVFLPAAIINGLIRSGKTTALLLLLSVAVSLIATFWFQGMVVQAVHDIQDGRRDFSLGGLFESAAPFVPPLIGAGILAGFGIAVGFILLIVPGLILLTIWALISPVIVMEKARVMESFGRSRALVKGNGWQVFGVIVLVFILNAIAAAILSTIFVGISSDAVGAALGSLVSNAIVGPVGGIATAVMYFELAITAAPPPAVPGAPAAPAAPPSASGELGAPPPASDPPAAPPADAPRSEPPPGASSQ